MFYVLLVYFFSLSYSYVSLAVGDKSDLFGSRSGTLFDRYAASESAANLVVSAVFNPERAERLATQRAINDTLPSLLEVMRAFSRNVILLPYASAVHAQSTIIKSDGEGLDLTQSNSVLVHEVHELDDCNGFKPVASAYLDKAINRNGDDRYHKKNQPNAADVRLSRNGMPPEHLRSQVGPSVETSQSNAAANEEFEAFPLESFISQSILLNSYLLLLTDAKSSFLVRSQLLAHLKDLASEIHKFLLIFQKAKETLESQNSQEIEGDYLILLEKISHLEMLSFSISSQKPFLSLLSTPMGPPI